MSQESANGSDTPIQSVHRKAFCANLIVMMGSYLPIHMRMASTKISNKWKAAYANSTVLKRAWKGYAVILAEMDKSYIVTRKTNEHICTVNLTKFGELLPFVDAWGILNVGLMKNKTIKERVLACSHIKIVHPERAELDFELDFENMYGHFVIPSEDRFQAEELHLETGGMMHGQASEVNFPKLTRVILDGVSDLVDESWKWAARHVEEATLGIEFENADSFDVLHVISPCPKLRKLALESISDLDVMFELEAGQEFVTSELPPVEELSLWNIMPTLLDCNGVEKTTRILKMRLDVDAVNGMVQIGAGPVLTRTCLFLSDWNVLSKVNLFVDVFCRDAKDLEVAVQDEMDHLDIECDGRPSVEFAVEVQVRCDCGVDECVLADELGWQQLVANFFANFFCRVCVSLERAAGPVV